MVRTNQGIKFWKIDDLEIVTNRDYSNRYFVIGIAPKQDKSTSIIGFRFFDEFTWFNQGSLSKKIDNSESFHIQHASGQIIDQRNLLNQQIYQETSNLSLGFSDGQNRFLAYFYNPQNYPKMNKSSVWLRNLRKNSRQFSFSEKNENKIEIFTHKNKRTRERLTLNSQGEGKWEEIPLSWREIEFDTDDENEQKEARKQKSAQCWAEGEKKRKERQDKAQKRSKNALF